MCFIVSLLGFLLTTLMYIKCETPSIPGVNTSYQKSSPGPPQLSSPCNQACNCSGVSYSPVCGGSLTYFSPCHAGCTIANKTQTGSWSYSDCTCLADIGQFPGEVNKGICLVECRVKFTLFLTLICATVFLTFLNYTPALIVTLRFALFVVIYFFNISSMKKHPRFNLAAKLFTQSRFCFLHSTLITFLHFLLLWAPDITHYTPCLPPKLCVTFVFYFSWNPHFRCVKPEIQHENKTTKILDCSS
ncbi:unnamed protein product [Porites evermanni]|uniref:Kazal-like domain-containing protein n=1 Tax=Porites evermanni TaxID=104178 RepID=A0ABN8T2T5_9CNID|nr:unnamed protein product [Porites evermanni]